jgi:hypothetical protein
MAAGLSHLQVFLYGGYGCLAFAVLQQYQGLLSAVRGGFKIVWSVYRVAGLAVVVIVQAALGGAVTLLVLNGSEARPIAAVAVGIAWSGVLSTMIIPSGESSAIHADLPRGSEMAHSRLFRDALKDSLKPFTAGRVTAGATAVLAIVEVIKLI